MGLYAAFTKGAVVAPADAGDPSNKPLWGVAEDVAERDHPPGSRPGLGVRPLPPRAAVDRLLSCNGGPQGARRVEIVDSDGREVASLAADADGSARLAPPGAAPSVRTAAVVFAGALSNEAELRQLYPPAAALCDEIEREGEGEESPSAQLRGARLVQALLATGFADEDGDVSDQPAAALASFRGRWCFGEWSGATTDGPLPHPGRLTHEGLARTISPCGPSTVTPPPRSVLPASLRPSRIHPRHRDPPRRAVGRRRPRRGRR